jgi:hypothetical protein
LPEKSFQVKHKTCGSWLASDEVGTANIDIACHTPIAGKPAPTGSSLLSEHEAFVMQPIGLRPNVAYSAGCSTVAVFAKNPYQTQAFT